MNVVLQQCLMLYRVVKTVKVFFFFSFFKFSIVFYQNNKKSKMSLLSVHFSVHFSTNFGEKLVVVGSNPAIGNWDLTRAIPLTWHNGGEWSGTAMFPRNTSFEYKYVVINSNDTSSQRWESSPNRPLLLTRFNLSVKDVWEYLHESIVKVLCDPDSKIPKTRLGGKEGPVVGKLGLGTMSMTPVYSSTVIFTTNFRILFFWFIIFYCTFHFFKENHEEESLRTIERALQSGINLFDTADIYGVTQGM
jgi:hypothetical protein